MLARAVAVKVMSAGGRQGAKAATPFLDAASVAGTFASPVLARVYDAAIEERPAQRSGRPAGEIDIAYVISEWVEGPTLGDLLGADGPMAPAESVALVTTLAEALGAAHARGLVHGRLHPGNVLLPRAGGVKITDLAVAASLPDRAMPRAREVEPDERAADVRDLAALLYACLTARWPASATPQPSGGVPAAPTARDGKRGRTISPRQIRAGVPRHLDAVVARALDPLRAPQAPTLTTTAGLCDALETALRADTPARPPGPRPPRTPRWVRRLFPLLVSLALLTGVGFVAYAAGRTVGEVEPSEDTVEALVSPSPGVRAVTPIDLGPVPITAYDPPPGDNRERPGSVPNAHDGDPSTVWETERYDSDAFGGRKDGVGLLVDLGKPTAVTGATVLVQTPGTTVELRGADTVGAGAGAFPVLATGSGTGTTLSFTPKAGTRNRYYLVWLTGLPKVDGRFVGGIAELRFTGG